MTLRTVISGLLAVGLAGAALAEAPERSMRPTPRPGEVALVPVRVNATAPARSLRPEPRPGGAVSVAAVDAAVAAVSVPARAPVQDPISAFLSSLTGTRPAAAAAAPAAALSGASRLAVARSQRPEPRPRNLETRVAAVSAPRAASSRGSVCGVAEIKGAAIAAIDGRGSCGIANPVRVTSVSGVKLSQAPTLDCTTAKALNAWVRDGVIPAVGRTGGGVARVNVIAHYACRTRNNRAGAKLSEHAKGHAVDISGITLKDGSTLTVLNHWRSSNFGKIIKAMHRSACGPFGTVLGPNADRYHQDHLHVDTARYRSGSYCK